jgi:hypothetical protein
MREKYIKAAKDACSHVHTVCPLGSSNRHNGESYASVDLATRALKKAKKNFYEEIEKIQSSDSCERDKSLLIIKLLANIAETSKAGNCQEMAAVAFLLLMAQGIVPIEIVSIPTHTFVIIGRNPDTCINKPETWNEEVVICDPWRRQHKCAGGSLYYKESMIYTSARLLEKLGSETCNKLVIGYAIVESPTFSEESVKTGDGPDSIIRGGAGAA